MGNFKSILFGAVAALAMIQPAFADPASGETPAQAAPAPAQPEATPETQAAPEATSTLDAVAPAAAADDPVLGVARSKLAAAKASDDEREKMDQTALTEFYAARHGDGLWVTASGLKPETKALITEIENANAYGLDASAFKLPMLENGALTATEISA